MADDKKKTRGLGRGLSALMADVGPTETASGRPGEAARPDSHVPIERITPNPNQPRQDFPKEDLQDLANSIREKGVIQPLIVRPKGDGYEIVAGERRWRAAQMAQLHELPVLVRDFDDIEVLEIAIIENIQRADLNPVEEAQGYRQLMDKFGHTQEKMAEALGKSRSHIANILRLLQLPQGVLDLLREGQLSAGHARALITAEDPMALARQVVTRGLSVRETEKLAKKPKPDSAKPAPRKPERDADTIALEKDLSANLGLPVRIDHNMQDGGGKLVLSYRTLDELDALCAALGSTPLDVTR